MKLLSVILLAGLLVLATTAFSQDTNAPVPEKGKPALSEVQGHGFGGPALQRGWDKQGGPRGPMFRGGQQGGPRGPMFRGGPPQGGPRGPMMGQGPQRGGPRGPMWAQGRGQGKGCACQCHEKQGKGKGKQHRHGRK